MTADAATWHIQLAARGPSGSETANFLWQHKNIFVMDNHRLAAWCWLRCLRGRDGFSLLHVDRHYDMLEVGDVVPAALPNDLGELTLKQYLEATYSIGGSDVTAFRWDNYIPIIMKKHPRFLRRMLAVTQGYGNYQQWMKDALSQGFRDEKQLWDIPSNLSRWIADRPQGGYSNKAIDRDQRRRNQRMRRALTSGNPELIFGRSAQTAAEPPAERWIFNLDLDFFFFGERKPERLFTDDYVRAVARALRENMAACDVLTICLSPECCGGWSQAENTMSIVAETLKLDFALPSGQ